MPCTVCCPFVVKQNGFHFLFSFLFLFFAPNFAVLRLNFYPLSVSLPLPLESPTKVLAIIHPPRLQWRIGSYRLRARVLFRRYDCHHSV